MRQARCEVLSNRRSGAYYALTLAGPDISEEARPGQFVQIAVPEGREIVLRRPFSVHRASKRGGWAGTLEVVFDVVGPGTAWLSSLSRHDVVDVIGPLGRPFAYPPQPTRCLLVGGGYGAAPLYFLAEELRARGMEVHLILGARSHDRVFKPVEGRRLAHSLVVTTDDGSMGHRGIVTDVMPSVMGRTKTQVVYACGPNAMLRAVSEYSGSRGVPCQVAVEELMACGLGVCWTCVVPIFGSQGRGWWNVRACTEGPVFNGARIWWDRWFGEPLRREEHELEPTEAAPMVHSRRP
ncbi:MAG TPA: dihydroorotate dehydrogenase electron transfer subunit [Actinomycetota bacterium]|nr:dihydroorotate dehydrogenase electron transfer subunit [Actinomycetota bacterium]